MDNKKNGIPKLRFPGFTGAWEQRKLGEVLSYEQPGPYIVNSDNYDNKFNVPVLTAGKSFILGFTNEVKGIKKASESDPVIIFDDFTTGSHYVDFPFKVKSSALKILSKTNEKIDTKFIYEVLSKINYVPQSHERHWISQFSKFNVMIPTSQEQEKVGNFLKQLDHLIALHQRKLEHLQEQKKGLLQKMFPKNGETVPEVRFPGFTDAWEQRKLGEVADIFDGTHQTPKYTDSGIKFVSVENIATLETEKYISQKAYESEYSNKQAEKGDVLMTRIGNIGTPKLIEKDEPLAYYVTLALLKPKNIDSNFLAWGISSPKVQRNIWKLTLHIAFPKKINLGEINQVSISIPSINEQKKIGDFFKQLDSLIALHQRKLDHLELMKKGLLQQMFV